MFSFVKEAAAARSGARSGLRGGWARPAFFVFFFWHTAKPCFAVCLFLIHGKIIIFFSFELKTFSTFYI